MRKRTPLARLRALMNGWFDFVETRQLPGGCVITAASSEYRARPDRYGTPSGNTAMAPARACAN